MNRHRNGHSVRKLSRSRLFIGNRRATVIQVARLISFLAVFAVIACIFAPQRSSAIDDKDIEQTIQKITHFVVGWNGMGQDEGTRIRAGIPDIRVNNIKVLKFHLAQKPQSNLDRRAVIIVELHNSLTVQTGTTNWTQILTYSLQSGPQPSKLGFRELQNKWQSRTVQEAETSAVKDMAKGGYEAGWVSESRQPEPEKAKTGTKQQYGTGTPSNPSRDDPDPNKPTWKPLSGDGSSQNPFSDTPPPGIEGIGDVPGPANLPQAILGILLPGVLIGLLGGLARGILGAGGMPPGLPSAGPSDSGSPQSPTDEPAAPPETHPDIEWTGPDGVKRVLVWHPEHNGYINILTGGLVDPDNIEGWKQNIGGTKQQTDESREHNKELTENGQDAQSQALNEIKKAAEERANALKNLGFMEKRVWDGPGSDLLQAPGGPGNILDNINKLADAIASGKPIDHQKLDAITRLYVDAVKGNILPPDRMPKPGDADKDALWDGVTGTGKGVLNLATMGLSEVAINHDAAKGSLTDEVAAHVTNLVTFGGYEGYQKGGVAGAFSGIVHSVLPIDEPGVLFGRDATWDQKAGAAGSAIIKILTLGKFATEIKLPSSIEKGLEPASQALASVKNVLTTEIKLPGSLGKGLGAASKAESAVVAGATKAEPQVASAATKTEIDATAAVPKRNVPTAAETEVSTVPGSKAPPSETDLKNSLNKVKQAEREVIPIEQQSPRVQKLASGMTDETTTVVQDGKAVQVTKTYVDEKGALEQLTDTASSRTAKQAPPEVREAIINTRQDKLYTPADQATIKAVGEKAEVQAMMKKGDELGMDSFQTPGKTGVSLGADRDARLVIKHSDGTMTEVPRKHWENKAYEDFHNHTTEVYNKGGGIPPEIQARIDQRVQGLQYLKGEGLTDAQIRARAFAQEHNQLFTDKYHVEAGLDNSDQLGSLTKPENIIPGEQLKANVQTAKGGGAPLQDPEGFARMWHEKSEFYKNNPPEALAQSKKGISEMLEVRSGYRAGGMEPPKLPAPIAKAMDVVIKAPTGVAATPAALASVEKELQALGFKDMHDAMSKIASQSENLKWSKPILGG